MPLHDFGCTLKAYRRRVLAGVRLYGEMHRFIPIFAAWQGAKVTEQVVNHRPRTAGKTKYGLGRTFNVVLDLILIRFLQSYAQRPIHFFGRFGLWSFAMAFVCFLAMLYFKWVFPWPISGGPRLSTQDLRRDAPALAHGHVLPRRRDEHPPGHPVRADHADLLRVQAKTTYLLREVRQVNRKIPWTGLVDGSLAAGRGQPSRMTPATTTSPPCIPESRQPMARFSNDGSQGSIIRGERQEVR